MNIGHIIALLKKDLLLEWRQKHTFYGVLLYIISTLFVMSLLFQDTPDSQTWNSLFWTTMLFFCVSAVAKSFLQESRGRMLYFYSISSPVDFIIAKLLYNGLLMTLLSCISFILFIFFLGNPLVEALTFCGIAILGGWSLSMVFTLMSAIAAKAQQNAAMMAILGFPILLPQLLMLSRLSKLAFAEVFEKGAVLQLSAIIVLMNVLVIALAVVLFPSLWKE